MKKILQHTVSFGMIFILLVSTLQFSWYKMECLISGSTKLSLTQFEKCNEQPTNSCSFSEKCCCFHEMSFDFEYETNFQTQSFKIINKFIVSKLPLSFKALNKDLLVFLYTNLPPPGGVELLKRVQVFRL